MLAIYISNQRGYGKKDNFVKQLVNVIGWDRGFLKMAYKGKITYHVPEVVKSLTPICKHQRIPESFWKPVRKL